jgi:hypothetical protein
MVHMWCYCQGGYGFCAGRETATAKTISVVGCQAKILSPMERRSLIYYLPFENLCLSVPAVPVLSLAVPLPAYANELLAYMLLNRTYGERNREAFQFAKF